VSAYGIAGPMFSIVVPVFNTPEQYLREAIASVHNQTFDDWELILVNDGSRIVHVARILDEAANADPRVRVEHLDENCGIVSASNVALRLARGEFVALLDHDDVLEPRALAFCADEVRDSDVDYLYTDEARLVDGEAIPSRKPIWSPERLRSQMYTSHLSVFRRSLVNDVGGFRTGFDGSQDYDLVLRVTERARRVVHVQQVLYFWRYVGESVSQVGRPEVFDAAKRAIEEHLGRVGIDGTVEQVDPTGVYRVRRRIVGSPLVSIIIPTRGSSGDVRGSPRTFVVDAVRSIVERSTYRNVEFIIVADDATPATVITELRAVAGERIRIVEFKDPFNFARKINLGAVHASGEYLLLLNDDIEVITPDWIEAMLGVAQDPEVGMVGAMLYFEDGTIQHAGHTYRLMAPGHIGFGEPATERGPMFAHGTQREVSGVTAACALVTRAVFHEVGGMAAQFPVNYNDVDFSFKVRGTGRRIVWTPFAQLYHFESKSRTPVIGSSEVAKIRRRWGRLMERDPYWP